jgi:hypothetical protein
MMKFRTETDAGSHYEFDARDARAAVLWTHHQENAAGKRASRQVTSLWYFDPAIGADGQWVSGDNLISEIGRPLSVIAEDIRDHWTNVYFGAVPYLRAMRQLNWVTDQYGADDGETIVNYFVNSNAATWRGPDARRIKAELRGMIAR